MPPSWFVPGPRPGYAPFRRLSLADDWFEAYEIAPDLIAFFEPRHYEETIANLVIGRDTAALIDTGCGIGRIARAVAQVTSLPILVVNTHTHTDHIAGNSEFDRIAAFDHPRTRGVAASGVSHGTYSRDLLSEGLVAEPWPIGFDADRAVVPPFRVERWLHDGDRIDLGGRTLEVIHTPGEAPDHICLLDRQHRLLFSGDILLEGPVWTHLEGASLVDLLSSYEKLQAYEGAFDRIMPSHNVPWVGKQVLSTALDGARRILNGTASFSEETDPWDRRLRRYAFNEIQILTLAS